MRRFMHFFFYHFYHALAWMYDAVAATVSLGRWKDWGRTALAFVQGERVLELGFGPGHLQVEIYRAGRQAFGLDESRQMTRQARHHLMRHGAPLRLVRGYTQHLPFASEVFDSVVSTFPSEYIADPQTLRETGRVLKRKGRLVIVPMAWMGANSLPERAMRWLFRITGQDDEGLEERIAAFLAEHGFRAVCSRVEVRHSMVLVIVAEKAEAE